VNTEVAGFTRKTGVFFAYGVDGPEFPPALYDLLDYIKAFYQVRYLMDPSKPPSNQLVCTVRF